MAQPLPPAPAVDADAVLTHSFLSYNMLKEVLEASNISDDEEVRSVWRSLYGADQSD